MAEILDKSIEEEPVLNDEALLDGLEDNSELLSVVSAYLKEISKYPLLSKEETNLLLRKYHLENDLSARQKLIECNLRLVVWELKTTKKLTNSYEFADRIQEGNIGLMKAIDAFDINRGTALSTYATEKIKREVNRQIDNKDKTIRLPVGKEDQIKKLKRFINNFLLKHNRFPKMSEMSKNLNMSEQQLKTLMDANSLTSAVESLNRSLKEEDDFTLEDTVEDKKSSSMSTHFENLLDDKILLYKLKKSLSPFHYYILFYRVLSGNKMPSPKLANIFGVKHQYVTQQLNASLEKVKNSNILSLATKKDISAIIEEDINPICFEKKVILIYLKEKVRNEEYLYLYYIWYLGYDESVFKKKYKISDSIFAVLKNTVNDTCGVFLKTTCENQLYKKIISFLRKKYTIAQMFELDVFPEKNTIFDTTIFDTIKLLNSLSKDELINLLGDNYEHLSSSQRKLIDDYYDENFVYNTPWLINTVEAKINLHLLGYKGNKNLPLSILYKVYLEHKDIFDSDYQVYLEGTLFSKFTGKKVPYNYDFKNMLKNTVIRLSQLYYHIDHYFEYELPDEIIKDIITKYDYLFTSEELIAINLHYINPEGNISLRELGEVLKIKPYVKTTVTNISSYAYKKVVDLYLGLSKNSVIANEEVYVKFINDPAFQMKPRNREICKRRFMGHKDYKEIQDEFGFKNTREVSNVIGKVIHSIDEHYYNVLNEVKYEPDKIKELFIAIPYFSELEQNIILDQFIKGLTAKEIYQKYGINREEYSKCTKKFTNHYLSNFRDKNITSEDVLKEYNAHISDQVLSEPQLKILIYYYGVICPINPKGEKLKPESIKQRLNSGEIYNDLKQANMMLGAKKKGLCGSELGRLSREDIQECLKDPNIPLTDDEKLLLRQIKGIDTDTLDLKTLASMHGVKDSSIKRRVMNAYISILKYQEGIKEKDIDYELDVVPNLRYFPLIEQTILTDIYKNKLDTIAVGKKYNLSDKYAYYIIQKLEKRLVYILKYPAARKFDFDYARSVLDNNDLPYYGDKELCHKIYNRYFGEDGELPDSRGVILQSLDIDENTNTSFMIRSLMLAVLMYKDGYRKLNSIEMEEIQNHYDKHKEEMYKNLKKYFERDIRRGDETKVNDLVMYEIIKEKESSLFHLSDMSTKEAISFIRKNPYGFTFLQLELIRNYFRIPKRVFISGKNKNKLYKIIGYYLKPPSEKFALKR